jgi:hypothetical protein
MTMTLKQALAFRLPNGKTIADASTEDWLEAYAFYDTEDLGELSTEEALQASLDRNRDFMEALKVIEENHYRLPNFEEANKVIAEKGE